MSLPSGSLVIRSVVGALIVAGLGVLALETSAQQAARMPPAAKEEFRVTTVDGVRLVGDFYPPGPKGRGRNSPCVMLLHGRPGPGVKGNRSDWGKFPQKLAAEGYAVLAFDFRGHGDSTGIEKEYLYWYNPSKVTSRNAPTKIASKDFKNLNDWLLLGNDVMEAKLFLNRLSSSEDGKFNSNNVIVIGSEEGGAIGALWAAHGFSGQWELVEDPTGRNQTIYAGPRLRIDNKPEGDDVSCLVWLSMQKGSLGNANANPQIDLALGALQKNGVGVMGVYGADDKASGTFFRKNIASLRSEKGRDNKEKYVDQKITNTKLVGTLLLGKEDTLNTEKVILTYLTKTVKNQPWQPKDKAEMQPSLFAINRFLQ